MKITVNETITFRIRDNKDKTKGDISIDGTHIIWRKGHQYPKNSTKITWKEFIEYMETRKP